MASLGEDSLTILTKWSIIWMQPCAACHLMLFDVAKEFNHWNYGISESNWIQNSSQTKKTQNHSLGNIFATWTEAKQQGSKHQTHHFIPTTIQKNPPKLIQMQNPLITIQRKKNYPKWCVVHTQSPLPRVFVSCFFGGPVLYDKTSPVILWAFASLHGCSSWRLADPTYQHANGKKNPPGDYTTQLKREYNTP